MLTHPGRPWWTVPVPHDEILRAIRDSARTDPAMYGDSFADVYDEWYRTLGDSDFVDAVARRLPSGAARVLELGVGTGRLVRELRDRRRPHVDRVTGIDASEAMLSRARDAGVHGFVDLCHGDFSADLPAGPFDLVFVGYKTLFNLADGDAVTRCISLVARRLAPGGAFMVDAVIPGGGSVEEHVEVRTMANGDVVRSVSIHDPVSRTVTGYFAPLHDGHESAVRRWSVHYLPPDELDRSAAAAGLVLESRWADGDGSEFTHESSRHVSTYARR